MGINGLPERLVKIRKEKGYTRKELSDLLGIPYRTLTNYENGEREPGHSFIVRIAKEFNVTTDYLLGLSDNSARADGSASTAAQKNATSKTDTADSIANRYKKLDEHGKRVVCAVVSEEERRMQALQKSEPEDNVIHIHWNDQPASAGKGFDLSDEYMEDWLVRYNELTRKADFCLNIQGHSMEPKFHDGDIALIRQQPSVGVGEIGLFVVDGKGYIKKQGPDRLISLNPDYDDVWPGEFSDFCCVGKVLGVLEPEWIVER